MHSTDNLEDGYIGSGDRLKYSIRKHGVENHSKEIIEDLSSRELAKEREKVLITEDLRNDIMCMNIAPGGGGGFVNDKHQKRFHVAGAVAVNKIRTARFVKKMSTNDEFRKSFIEMSRLKMISRNLVGDRNPMFGHVYSEKTLVKMRTSHLGKLNSSFGTRWVCKHGKAIKILKEQLESYLTQGYAKGRR